MSMKDTLKKAKIAAMKAKDKAKLNPINLTLADIQNLEIANGHEATDEEVLKVIQKGVKTRRETAKLYEDKGLADKAAPETAEADFLETFLPAAASDAEVSLLPNITHRKVPNYSKTVWKSLASKCTVTT